MVGRYKGRIKGCRTSSTRPLTRTHVEEEPWLEIGGEEFIAKAFEYAHAADPDAELYYNDYNLWKPEKRAGAIRLVQVRSGPRAFAWTGSANRAIGTSTDVRIRDRRDVLDLAKAASRYW